MLKKEQKKKKKQNKKETYLVDFYCSSGLQSENKSEKIDKYLDLARELENVEQR